MQGAVNVFAAANKRRGTVLSMAWRGFAPNQLK